METQLSHLDQYKMLREEIMWRAQEISRTENWGAIAVASVYTWLLLNKQAVQSLHSRAIWFVAPCLIFVGAIRCIDNIIRINSIAGYLRLIEEVAFGEDPKQKLPGWERYLTNTVFHSWTIASIVTTVVTWPLAFIASIVASYLLSR